MLHKGWRCISHSMSDRMLRQPSRSWLLSSGYCCSMKPSNWGQTKLEAKCHSIQQSNNDYYTLLTAVLYGLHRDCLSSHASYECYWHEYLYLHLRSSPWSSISKYGSIYTVFTAVLFKYGLHHECLSFMRPTYVIYINIYIYIYGLHRGPPSMVLSIYGLHRRLI